MTSEAFKRHTKQIINLQATVIGEMKEPYVPTPAIDIINCIRHWNFKPQIPVRAMFILNGGSVIDCKLKDELGLWKVLKMRGLLNDVLRDLIPSDFWDKV